MIEAQNLVKWFGPKLAVDDVSFTVERGEVLGFLGPNGAGKSTTMRMITGFLPPSGGRVTIGGADMVDQGIEARTQIGYLPENAPAYPEMTVQAFLEFVAEVRGLSGQEKKQAVDRAVKTCWLQPVFHQTIETLSKGYRHRVCFAQAIIHDPPVLVMDEPTDGLDPNQKHEVRNLIKDMGREKAIIISTHILEEVDAVCSRVIIIDRGKLVFNGSPAELRGKSVEAGAVRVRLVGVPGNEVKQALGSLPSVAAVTIVEETEAGTMAHVRPKKTGGQTPGLAQAVTGLVREKGWDMDELHTLEGRLDEVFRTITISETSQTPDGQRTDAPAASPQPEAGSAQQSGAPQTEEGQE